jgi:XTP/dITP diphosphohydrolase
VQEPSLNKRQLVIATKNRGKLEEFKVALQGLDLTFLSLYDFPQLPPIIEDGAAFAANAFIKANTVVQYTKLPALADDSGLEVDFLGGAPGVLSARFAGRDGDDAANNTKLLRLLDGVPKPLRTARFRCVLAVVTNTGKVLTATGTIEGYIGTELRGSGGFGYDPLFVVPEYKCTLSELSLAEKNAISHRGKALKKLRNIIKDIFV